MPSYSSGEAPESPDRLLTMWYAVEKGSDDAVAILQNSKESLIAVVV